MLANYVYIVCLKLTYPYYNLRNTIFNDVGVNDQMLILLHTRKTAKCKTTAHYLTRSLMYF